MDERHRKYENIKPFIKLKNDMGSEDIHYSVFYEGIPNEFYDVALKDLNETEKNKSIGLLKLRDFLKGKCITDVEDHILITVLRACKYNIKISEKKLIKYLQTQDLITKWLQTVDLKKLEIMLQHRNVGFLPYRDSHGRVVFYTSVYDIDFEQYTVDDCSFCALCTFLYALNFPLTTITGIAYIAECKSSSLPIFYPIIKGFKRHIPKLFAIPFRLARVEFINENFVIRWGYNVMKPFVPSKILNRIQFHGNDLQTLQNMYHPAILPEEFGGTLGPINPKLYMNDVLKFIKKLKSRNLYLQDK